MIQEVNWAFFSFKLNLSQRRRLSPAYAASLPRTIVILLFIYLFRQKGNTKTHNTIKSIHKNTLKQLLTKFAHIKHNLLHTQQYRLNPTELKYFIMGDTKIAY